MRYSGARTTGDPGKTAEGIAKSWPVSVRAAERYPPSSDDARSGPRVYDR